MSAKQDVGSTDIATSTADGLVKKILEDVTTGIGGEVLSEVPVVSSLFAVGRAISALKDARYRKNLISFFNESEENKGFMKRFFEDKSNAEIGLEILGLVERSYLEQQAEMLARATRMWRETKEIDKEKFDEYANIILSFDAYLIRQFEAYINYKRPIKSANQGIVIGPNGINLGEPKHEMFLHPNMFFVSIGFLRQNEIKNVAMGGSFNKESHYSITEKAYDFYEKIFKGKGID